MKRRISPTPQHDDRVSILRARARRHRRRHESRRAMLVLREAVHLASDDASLWTSYAIACLHAGRQEDAEESLKQALWLRRRYRDSARESVTASLLESLRQNDDQLRVRAA